MSNETQRSSAQETVPEVTSAPARADKKPFPFTIVRHVVQVFVLLLFMLPVLAAGWSLFGGTTGGNEPLASTPSQMVLYGSLSSTSIFGITVLDPFAMLQVVFAGKTFSLDLLVGVLPVLVVYGLIRGRAFCGWTCPVNLVLEIVDWLRKKLHLQAPERVLPRRTKVYVAAAVLVLSAILSFPVFETLSPISFINKGILFGSIVGGVTLLAVILVELFWGHRVWCRAICPLGGFYELLGKVGFISVKIDHDACIGCNKCKKACLCDPEILDAPVAGETDRVCAGDCMLCGKCIEECPVHALSMGVVPPTKKR